MNQQLFLSLVVLKVGSIFVTVFLWHRGGRASRSLGMWLQFSLDSGIPGILKEQGISSAGQRKWVSTQLERFHA